MQLIETLETGKKYYLPETWNELTDKQFVYLSELIYQLIQNKISVSDVRNMFIIFLFNCFDIKKFNKRHKEKIYQNVALLSTHFRFPFKIEYDDKEMIKTFSRNIQEKLIRYEPTEIYDQELENKKIDFYRYDEKSNQYILKGKYLIDLQLTKNLIKKIDLKKIQLFGPDFEILNNGIISTNITAEEFVDAYEYYKIYSVSNNEIDLNLLVSCFFREKINDSRVKYNTVAEQKKAVVFDKVKIGYKYGVFLFFESLMNYLMNHIYYGLLWNKGNEADNKISLGLGETILNLCEKHGGLQEVRNLNLTEYLDLLLKERIDYVKLLNEYEYSRDEICKKAGISMNQLNRII